MVRKSQYMEQAHTVDEKGLFRSENLFHIWSGFRLVRWGLLWYKGTCKLLLHPNRKRGFAPVS